jgi:hypothetical protein
LVFIELGIGMLFGIPLYWQIYISMLLVYPFHWYQFELNFEPGVPKTYQKMNGLLLAKSHNQQSSKAFEMFYMAGI